MCNPKLILVSETGYRKKYNAFLKLQLEEGCELFCITGKAPKQWINAINQLAKTTATATDITCSYQKNKNLQELEDFASQFKTYAMPNSQADIVYV